MPDFSWVPFFEELADKLLKFKNNRRELIKLMRTSFSEANKVMTEINDDIDPFTVFSNLNYTGTDDDKKSLLFEKIKNNFTIESAVPTGFDGVPQSRNVNPNFFKQPVDGGHFDILWDTFESVIKYSKDKSNENKLDLINKFDSCIVLNNVKQVNLTMGFYWCRPNDFVSLDKKNIACFNEFECFDDIKGIINNNSITGEQYFIILDKLNECLSNGKIDRMNNIPAFSDKAQKLSENNDIDYIKILEYIDFISNYWNEKYTKEGENSGLIKSKAKEVNNILTQIHNILSERYGFTEKDIHQWQNSGNLNTYSWMETKKHKYVEKPISISLFADKSHLDGATRFGISLEIKEKYAKENPESWDLYYKYLDYPLNKDSVLKYYQSSHSNNLSALVSLSADEIKANISAYKNPNEKIKLCCFINKNDKYNNNDYERLILQAYEQIIPFYDYVVGATKSVEQVSIEGKGNMNELKEFQKNMILYGPPGTSKTYSSSIFAVGICEGKKPSEIIKEASMPNGYKAIMERYKDLKARERIKFTTFHQSYGYEEFIEGIQPSTENGQVKYSIEDGVFKDFCRKAELGDDFEKLFNELINKINNAENKQLLIETQSSTSMTLEVNSKGNINFHLNNNAESGGTITKDALKAYYFNLDNKYKYWSTYYKGVINYMKSNFEATTNEPYVFIIDEINRGNISKIFGELITLIEPSKRSGMEDCVPAILPYSGVEFSVPNNVYIIGTMNTADRSISLIDTALRRRFKFVEMMPETDMFNDIKVDGVNIKFLLDTINNRIEALYDREHTLGQAYFVELLKEEKRNIETLGSIFENQIIPLLQEYFYDDYNKIRLILGDNSKESEDTQFVTVKRIGSDLFKQGGEIPEFARDKFIINNQACYKIESYKGIF